MHPPYTQESEKQKRVLQVFIISLIYLEGSISVCDMPLLAVILQFQLYQSSLSDSYPYLRLPHPCFDCRQHIFLILLK